MNTRRSVAWELAAIAAAALLFVATVRVRPPYIDFVLAAAAVALIVGTATRSRKLWTLAPAAEPNAIRRAWRTNALFTAVALAVLAALAAVVAHLGGIDWTERFGNWHWFLAVPLYLAWALLQQYIFQFYWLGRWLQLVPAPVAVGLTALSFAAVHFPRWPVMILTSIAGVVWTVSYLRWRRLLPLAVSHALLGASLHYWVFGRDLLEAWLPF